jgi:Xaa-Pro aminopeptidase
VTAVLICADSIRSPDMRHEVPLSVPDAFLYLESDGTRAVVCSAFEMQRIKEADSSIETLSPEAFGADELLAQGLSRDEAELEAYVRACHRFGITSAAVPPAFPLELADHLRANGIDVASDRELFAERRRSADRNNGTLELGGEPLTVERIKLEIERVFSAHGVVGDEFIVSHGAQTAIGHEMGSGTLRPDEPIVFDLFPRDRATGVYSDMTRTYVVGTPSDELRGYHRLCKQALEETTAATKPGVNGRDLMVMACELFHAHGHKTQLHKEPGEVLESGFFHGLGHGVGLEVHEPPSLSRSGDDLVPGDVITLEPGLYRAGYGGVRLEDILLVTDDGAEVITDYPYDLDP